jgi:hypothetical protein
MPFFLPNIPINISTSMELFIFQLAQKIQKRVDPKIEIIIDVNQGLIKIVNCYRARLLTLFKLSEQYY